MESLEMSSLREGDYVLATKYRDGDPGDHFAVGFYLKPLITAYDLPGENRHIVVDSNGNPFRANGFRRVKKISKERGEWLLSHIKEIETGMRSVWWWARASMKRTL